MANEFIIKNGYKSRGNAEITGSINISSTASAGYFVGNGSGITGNVASALTASYVLQAVSASYAPVSLPAGILSGSAQIATEISGAFTAPSASFSTRVTSNTTNIGTLTAATASYLTSLPSGILSGSAQIATEISGAFTAPSASFSTRVTANEVVTAKTLVSSSAQIATEISGAFAAPSASFSTRVTTNETNISTLTSVTSSYATTASNQFNGNQNITGSLYVTGSNGNIDSNAGILYDSSGISSLRYAQRGLYASNNTLSVAYNTRRLYRNDGTTISFDWEAGDLNDNSGTLAIDLGERKLHDRFGTEIGRFTTTGTAYFSGSLIGTASWAENVTSASFALTGDGTFSGSFSGSFEGDGFGLTDVPVTIDNTIWVAETGDDSTAQINNIQRPWASISASLNGAVSGDSVILKPGTYIEPPFTVPAGVTLTSLTGLTSTTISSSNNSARFITQKQDTRLSGFSVVCPSGSFAGIYYDNPGGASIYDVTLKGTGESIGFEISQSTATTSKVIYNEFRYGGGNFSKLAYVKGGILAADGIHVPGGGSIDKVYHVEAGRLQAANTNVGNPNVSSSFYIEGGTNIILGTNLFNVQEAFQVASQDYVIQATNVYVDDNVDKHITIASGISGSSTSIFNIVSGHMQAAKIFANPDWVTSNHAFSFQDDGVTLDPAFRLYSDVEVGHANKGFQFGAGEGLPYNKGMKIINSGSGGVSTDVTTAATSRDSSTFVFTYSGSNDAMYFGNTQKDPTIDDMYLYFTGLQYKQVNTGSYSPGDLALEIYTTASTWVPIDGAQTLSSKEGYNYGNNVFSHNDSEEEVIANVKTDIWATSSLFSTEARWGRIRVVNPITTSPVFEQFIYTPNTTIINPKGQLSFRGKALSRQTVPIVGNTWGDDGLANPTLNNIGNDATWDHKIMNTRMNSNADTAYNQLAIPAGVCTAYPMNIQISFRANAAITATVEIAIVQQTGVKVNDPAGGKIPTARTSANTTDYDDAAVPITTFSVAVPDTNNTIEVFELSPVDISTFYEGDLILIRVINASNANNLDIVDTNLTFVKWTLGERAV